MRELISTGLRYQHQQLLVLNQQKLPLEEEWLLCRSPQQMCEIIRQLQVRGAPLIGIAASLALAQFAEKTDNIVDILFAAEHLKASRPTAVNLAYCIDRQLKAFQESKSIQSIITTAEELFVEDARLCEKIAAYGNTLINDADHVLTHCNTGGLVTTGRGTALGVLMYAHQQHKKIHVYVDETRPLLQGARLNTWELHRAQVPYTLLCDNMAASLMAAGKIQKIIVGADRIARNGDFANKIGTYSLAVLAHYHHIPFYVAAPYTTVDLHCATGNDIVIEQRAADEVRGFSNTIHKMIWSEKDAAVYNPAFDVTPGKLVTAFILDKGIFKANEKNFSLHNDVMLANHS